eukprot:COSAG02_NODE_441_length_22281_cov_6.119556_4_plen_80_part_00
MHVMAHAAHRDRRRLLPRLVPGARGLFSNTDCSRIEKNNAPALDFASPLRIVGVSAESHSTLRQGWLRLGHGEHTEKYS